MLRTFLRATGQDFMNLRLGAAGGLVVHILERPGLWMAPAELDALRADLRHIAAKSLAAGDLDYGVFSSDSTRLNDTIVTLIKRRSDNAPVGFNALAVMDVDLGHKSVQVVHLGLVMVDPEQRSQGLSWILYGLTCVLLLFRGGMRPLWISNVTQVPSVVGIVSAGFANVFPAPVEPRTDRRSLMHLLLARAIMRDHRHVFGVGPEAPFDEDRFVIENAYTGGSDHLKKSFAEAPKHRNDVINRYCERELDYGRGDDVLQLGQIDASAALEYLARDVPKRSVASVGLAISAVALRRLVLPVWYWSDSRRDFGILRAREQKP